MKTNDKYGSTIFNCDTCGEAFDTEEVDFKVAWEIAKANGWRYTGEGKHSCYECSAEIDASLAPLPKDDPFARFR